MLSASVSPPSPPLASLQGVPEQGPPVLSQLFGLPLLRATIMCWILINTRRPEKNSSRSYSWTPPHCPFPLLVMNQHPLPPEEPRPTQCIHTHIHTELERGWTLTPDICPSPFPTRLSDGLSITSGPRLGNCCLVITSHVVFFFWFFFQGAMKNGANIAQEDTSLASFQQITACGGRTIAGEFSRLGWKIIAFRFKKKKKKKKIQIGERSWNKDGKKKKK